MLFTRQAVVSNELTCSVNDQNWKFIFLRNIAIPKSELSELVTGS